jgi:hypothetical protein
MWTCHLANIDVLPGPWRAECPPDIRERRKPS